MSQSTFPITELDFFRNKNQLKEFLRNDPSGKFRDFDFEGSNMSVLLDVLAYNTYQNNFYTNMAISEMFLDSAQMQNSVVSHAKELNYLPRSATSARAVVNITISAPGETASFITIPENTRFTANYVGQRYNFYTNAVHLARRSGSNYIAENIDIYEGEIVQEAFFVSGTRNTIRLINKDIDTSSIRVFENYDQPANRLEYTYRKDIFGVETNDAVFYLEPSFDDTYEILFGNNKFGREPANNTQIKVFYRITNGPEANGACRFSTSFRPNVSVISTQNATGGAEKETIEDTKFFAPRSIQVQERAVTERDYEILLKQRFNEIQDIAVIGGDELDPPRFGKVAIVVNIEGGLSEIAARRYETYLRDKTPVTIQPIFLPPEFLYIDLDIDVVYSSRQTAKSKDDLERDIRNMLKTYNQNTLSKFGASFEISRVSAMIDSLDTSIINNTISATPYISYAPEFLRKDSPTFNFETPLESPCRFARANRSETYNSFVRSSIFVFNNTNAILEDNGLGVINVLNSRSRSLGQIEIMRRNAGTVDYATGEVKLSDFITEFYQPPGIKITANTRDMNVVSPRRRVLLLRDQDIRIHIKETSER
jgi:hypothetical protein